MKRWLGLVAVVGAVGFAALLLPLRSEAGRGGGGGGHGGGGHGGGGHAVGPARGVGPGGFHPGFDRGFDRDRRVFVGVGGWGGWGGGWGYGPYGYGYGYGYGPGVSYVYDEQPGYVGADQAVAPDGYADDQAEPANVARVTVRLPGPDATVWFNGARMLATGATRSFVTPPLDPGQDYHYAVKVRWMEDGQAQEQTRTLDVRAGESFMLNFTRPANPGSRSPGLQPRKGGARPVPID
jgi:uncharacterized protein (TIGR03000 family)